MRERGGLFAVPAARCISYAMDWTICIAKAVTIVRFELRWLYGRRDDAEAHGDLAAWVLCWQEKYPKLSAWVEENIEAFACHQPGGSSSSPKLQRSLDILHVKGTARKTKIL